MELVMLGNMDKQGLLDEFEAKKRRERQENNVNGCCKIEIFNLMQEGAIDSAVSKKLAELRRVETEKIKTEEAERKKFRNALMLTDIQATIKKAGFHPDGSPKMAVAGFFDNSAELVRDD